MSFRRRTTDSIAELQRQVETLTAKAGPPPPPGAPTAPSANGPFAPPQPGTSLIEVHDLVRSLSERVDGLDARQLGDHERLSLRLEELTAQFSNQLLEMSHELDDGHQRVASQLAAQEQRLEELAAAATTVEGTDDSRTKLIEELRANQVRIANELARHQIAFRQDLADLADLVGRSRRSTT